MGFLDNLTEIATDLAQSGAAASKHLAETSIATSKRLAEIAKHARNHHRGHRHGSQHADHRPLRHDRIERQQREIKRRAHHDLKQQQRSQQPG